MRRHVLPVAVSLVALTTGCGGGDPSGPTFDPLAISAATLPPAVPSIAYNVSLSATGGDGSYTWSVIGGSPPSGLSLVASGVILGTPTGSTSTFTAQVVSGDGQTASQEFTISVNDVLTMTTEALPQGLMNALYNETLVASGGAGAYSWSLAAGTPPAGLSLDASSGLISGTPSVGETATFTVEVASGDGQTAQQALTIKIGFVVNTTDDSTDGACDVTHCSLREALTGANAEAGTDIVHFDIPGAGLHSIQPTSALPTISDAVFVDGYTQAGASTNTNGPELGSNAVLMIELDGTAAGSTASGLRLTAGGSTVRGLVINRFGGPAGIELLTNGGNLVEGNFIGTDAAGTVDLGNLGSGIRVDRAPDNTIGGTLPAARNVISGNESFGISIGFFSPENTVQGNLIGTDLTGTVDLGNTLVGLGTASSNTMIGGSAVGAGNVISGNGASGIQLSGVGSGVSGSVVEGNLVGIDVTGTLALGNDHSGIAIFDNANTTIGGAAPGAGNVISSNHSSGVQISGAQGTVVQGNLIGTDASGASDLGNGAHGVLIEEFNTYHATDNAVGGIAAGAGNVISANGSAGVRISGASSIGNLAQGNSIFANSGLGLDLDLLGLTTNDVGDGDAGPNNLQNFPVLTSATTGDGSIEIAGDLNSAAGTEFRLEFFVSSSCDSSGNGEGEAFLGSGMVTTDGGGDAAFSVTLTGSVGVGEFVTSTATDPENNTSEFSSCVAAT